MTSGIISEPCLYNIYFYLWLHVEHSRLHEFHHSMNWFKLICICRYAYNIFGDAQIFTNDSFLPNSFSTKEDYFRITLLSSENNWLGRAPILSLFSWLFLRRFNLLRHIYVGFTNISFYEHLNYNPFIRTSIILNIVFLTWYDLTPYSLVLPISISALVFRLRSISFSCIILRHYLNRT